MTQVERIALSDEVSLSQIVLGLWRLTDYGDSSPAAIQERIEAALEQGVTTLDQADIYGGYMSEEVLGKAFRAAPGLRDKLEIITKCDIVAPVGRYADKSVKYYDTSRAHILSSAEHSLSLMGIEQIDLLLIHRPDPLMDHFETGGALDELVASGKVRSVGVSNFKPWDVELLQSAMKNPLLTNQVEISLMHSQAMTNGDLAFHQKNGTPVMAWSPLGGGALFSEASEGLRKRLTNIGEAQNIDASAVAIAWLLAHPAQIVPVLGTNTLDRIRKIGDAARVKIDRETWFELYTLALGHEVA